jgi:uncharacterized protein (DUF362 family)
MGKRNPVVSIVRTPTDYSDVESAVRQAVELCGGLPVMAEAAGKNILIKPNLVETNDGESGNTTDKRVIGVLVAMAIAQSAKVTVGDSAGTRWHGATDRAFKETGIREYCESLGATVVSFDKTDPVTVDIPDGRVLKEAYLARQTIEADLVINAPKMKTHILTKTTGAVKNLFGAVPGGLKSVYHKTGGNSVRFASLIVDLYSVIMPGLTVMDCVVGLGGQWRLQDRIYPGVILAGTDGVAVDAVAAHILGFNPMKVPILADAHRRGLGVANLNDIAIVGEPLEPIIKAIAGKTKRLHVPSFGNAVGGWLLSRESPEVDPDLCSACGHCPKACPVDAVAIEDGCPQFDLDKCIRCFCCAELCPERAIRLTRGRVGNLFFKR